MPLLEQAPPTTKPAPDCPKAPSHAPDMPHGWVRFPQASGKPRIEVELADTEANRARGLMYRTELGEDSGMLFRWSSESYRSFWMRNTCIPLDMMFIAADGTIVGVLEQVPTMNDLPRRVPCPAAYVLEVNAGWTRAHGVAPGQRIEIDA